MEQVFHPMLGLSAQEKRERPDTREFKGDGTPYLRVPGLLVLAALRVGSLDLPLDISQRVPLNAAQTEFETQTTPMVVVDMAPDGCPVLLRNVQSNDGMWQPGVPVYVSGAWDEGFTDPSPAAAGVVVDALAEMKSELESLRAAAGNGQENPQVVSALAEMKRELEELRSLAQKPAPEATSMSVVQGAEEGKAAQIKREQQAALKEANTDKRGK